VLQESTYEKDFSEGLKKEVSMLYDLGLEVHEIEFIIYLRNRRNFFEY
jgi:hypothetical protein